MRLRPALALALAPLAALRAQPAPRLTLDAVLDAEDARAATDEQLTVLKASARDPSRALRVVAVRALGRLQRPSLIPDIAAALGDASPEVRAVAATALLDAAALDGTAEARTPLIFHLTVERDPAVVGALAEALGWLPERDTARVAGTAHTLAAHARTALEKEMPSVALRGVAHGLFGLARQPAARHGLPSDVVRRLTELAGYHRSGGSSADVEVRVLAAYALAAAEHASEVALAAVLADPDPRVRAAATRAVGSGMLTDTAAAERVGRRALADPAPSVRSLAVSAWARRFGVRLGCAPFVAAAHDSATSVRLPALDALGTACEAGSSAAALLDSVAGTLPAPRGTDAGAWHASAHALVALAAVAPERVRARLGAFVSSPDFFVREYYALTHGRY